MKLDPCVRAVQMKEQLEAAAKKEKELEADVQRRAGENFIIRSRHSKVSPERSRFYSRKFC